MLQSIRDNSQGIIAKVIVGLIAVTFALFGVESLVSLSSGSSAPATVNGVEISEQQLYQGVELQRRQLLAQMGENADPALLDDNLIRGMVLESLIEQSVLVQAAEDEGLAFSDRMIDQLIVSTPGFQQEGKFSREQFELALRSAGFTPLTYRQLLRQEKLIEQQRAAYQLSAFALDFEVDQVVALDRQTRDLRYFTLPAAQVREGLEITDEALSAHYEQTRSQYMTEEQLVLEYLLLSKDDLAAEVDVTEDELQQQYQALLDSFAAEELRQGAHILVEINETRDEAAAKARAEALAARLRNGEAFAALAQAESDDLGSAESGGDLGLSGKGVFVPEFEEALYTLNKGEVSAPVRTEFGYHLIKLLDLQVSEPPSFAEAQPGLAQELRNEKAEGLYVERLEQLADISFSAGDLAEPADTLGLAIQTTAPFGREGGADRVSSNLKVLREAFSAELLSEPVNSTPIELDSANAVVIRVKQHLPPRAQTLSEVQEQLRSELLAAETARQLEQQAAALLTRLQQGEAVTAVAGEYPVSEVKGMARNQAGVPPALRSEAFRMPRPAAGASSYGVVALQDGSRALVLLDAVTDGSSADLSAEDRKNMGLILGSQAGQTDYRGFAAARNDAAEIERL